MLLLHWYHHCRTSWFLDFLVNAYAVHGCPSVDHAPGYRAYLWQPYAPQRGMDWTRGTVLCGGSYDNGVPLLVFSHHCDAHLGLCLPGIFRAFRDGLKLRFKKLFTWCDFSCAFTCFVDCQGLEVLGFGMARLEPFNRYAR